MDNAGIRVWRKLGVLGAICLVAALGELRAADLAATTSTRPRSTIASGPLTNVRESGVVARLCRGNDGSAPAGNPSDSTDEERLVPAIYAWDPDVRFVYFRHVSKWM